MKDQTIRPRGELPTFHEPPTITALDIQTATGLTDCSRSHRKYHRSRIEEWGRINREVLRSLGAEIVRA